MDIFISHSNQDKLIARELILLIRSALLIPAARIRCTSVDGYRLGSGAATDQTLRKEVESSKVLISIISDNSISSAYVMFELGARWVLEKPLIPVVLNEDGIKLLRGPLGGFNAMNIAVPAQLHQLISDLGGLLGIKPESPAVYQDHLDLVSSVL